MATRSPRKPRPLRWTSALLARLPDDGNRYEALDGALLVTPQAGPFHQRIAFLLGYALEPYCASHGLGVVFVEGAILFGRNELQPDVLVLPIGSRQALTTQWKGAPRPLIVIEVLSPGSERYDRISKREAYGRLGIPEYWVVDIDKRHVEVYRPESEVPVIASDFVRWAPRTSIAPLEVDLEKLFR